MPTVADDRRALDLLASGSVPEQLKPKVMEKLGIDDNDVRAWSLASTAPQDQAKMVRDKVYEKVANVRKIEDPETFSGSQAVRFIAKNFLDQDIETQKKFFRKMGYDAKSDEFGTLSAYDPKTKRRISLDPKSMDVWDISDVMTDVIEGIGVGAATVGAAKGGAALGAAAGSLGGPIGTAIGGTVGAIGGGLLGAAGLGGLAEFGRQAVSKAQDVRKEYDPERIYEQAKYSAMFAPLDLIGLGISKWGAKDAAKRAAGQVERAVAEKVRAGMKVLGIEELPGMFSDNPTTRELLGSLLAQEGKIGGENIRLMKQSNDKKIAGILESFIAPTESITKYEAGEKFGKVATEMLKQKLSPAITTYQKYDDIFKDVNLNDALGPGEKGLIAIAAKQGKKRSGWLEKNMQDTLDNLRDRVAGQDKKVLNETLGWFENRIKTAKNINDITVTMRNIRDNAMKNANDPIWQYMNDFVRNDLKQVRSKAMMDLAKKNPELGETAVKELKLADQIFAQGANELENLIGKKKLKPGVRSSLERYLDLTPEMARVDAIIAMNDPRRIARASQEFPEAFNILRDGYKNEFIKRLENHVGKEGLNTTKAIKELDALPKESRDIIFGDNSDQVVKTLKSYYQALPEHVNPSKTEKWRRFLEKFSLFGYGPSEFSSMIQERTLKGMLDRNETFKQLLGKKVTKGIQYARPILYPTGNREDNRPVLIPAGGQQ